MSTFPLPIPATPLEFIEQATQRYINNPSLRAKDRNGCQYQILEEDGSERRCLVGSYMNDAQLNAALAAQCNASMSLGCNDLPYYALPDVPGGLDLLGDLQDWHDMSHHWDANGLTDAGRSCLKRIKERWL